mgnify:FL=1
MPSCDLHRRCGVTCLCTTVQSTQVLQRVWRFNVLPAIGPGGAGLAFQYAVLGSAVSTGTAELGCHDAALLSAPALWVWRVCYHVIGPGAMGLN